MLNIEDRGRALVPEDALAPAGEPGSERTRGEERERRKNGEKRPERDERREGGEDRGWRLKVFVYLLCPALIGLNLMLMKSLDPPFELKNKKIIFLLFSMNCQIIVVFKCLTVSVCQVKI